MPQNTIFYVVSGAVALFGIIGFIFYRKERKKKMEYKIKYWDTCLELKKNQAKMNFVSARNSVNSFHSVVPTFYSRYDELRDWFAVELAKAISNATEFKYIFVIFASFEESRDKELWEKIKAANPEIVTHLTAIVTKETSTLKRFSEHHVDPDEKERLRIIAEKVFQFIRQGFLGTKKGDALELTARSIKESFEVKPMARL